MRDNANEERRSEGREMGQTAEQRISGLKRNGPVMLHKYKKKGEQRGRIQREVGMQRKPEYKDDMWKSGGRKTASHHRSDAAFKETLRSIREAQRRGHIHIIELIIKCLHVGSGIPAPLLYSLRTAHISYHVVALMARLQNC